MDMGHIDGLRYSPLLFEKIGIKVWVNDLLNTGFKPSANLYLRNIAKLRGLLETDDIIM